PARSADTQRHLVRRTTQGDRHSSSQPPSTIRHRARSTPSYSHPAARRRTPWSKERSRKDTVLPARRSGADGFAFLLLSANVIGERAAQLHSQYSVGLWCGQARTHKGPVPLM